jgi:hypothetical protein
MKLYLPRSFQIPVIMAAAGGGFNCCINSNLFIVLLSLLLHIVISAQECDARMLLLML